VVRAWFSFSSFFPNPKRGRRSSRSSKKQFRKILKGSSTQNEGSGNMFNYHRVLLLVVVVAVVVAACILPR